MEDDFEDEPVVLIPHEGIRSCATLLRAKVAGLTCVAMIEVVDIDLTPYFERP